ncbi:sensor histidine kinase [Yinghuangia seranimata]|uniref:sensor histidine kinase n=1 Tax=Yinghuangia seranimata TaxID=408067 RepID=UPI00248CAC57|nr:sensor histidine kinase [Yinghuangia seranimata]MDI2124547.1 sensor histidine kinase [Yinghuangia seranimata]
MTTNPHASPADPWGGPDEADPEGLTAPDRPASLRRTVAERLRTPGPWGGDGLLALFVFGAQIGMALHGDGPRGGDAPMRAITDPVLIANHDGPELFDFAVMAALSLPLAWRRTQPVAVFGFLLGVVVLRPPRDLSALVIAALLIGGYTVAAHHRRRSTAVVVFVVSSLLLAVKFPGGSGPPGMMVFVIMGLLWVGGRNISNWRARAGALHGRALRAERERELAVAQERARIARELHDVVSHNVSVMVIQSGAARKILGTDPEAATEALRAVEASGRETMAELRQLLGVLNGPSGDGPIEGLPGEPVGTDDEYAPPLAPQPDLARLPALVERVRGAGQDIRLRVTGDPRPLPPGLELTGYRIVQEALTNALRYAPGAATSVRVRYDADSLHLDVTDDGAPDAHRGEPQGAGRGLIGLQERVARHGGHLQAGPRPTGGFRVRASIPFATTTGGAL